MSKKEIFFWHLYLFIYVLIVLEDALGFFDPASSINLYFQLTRAFGKPFHIDYFLNVTRLGLNLIHILPLMLYIYRVPLLNADTWMSLLILRLIFDIVGHAFELNYYVALFKSNLHYGLTVSLITLAVYVPSYIICFAYAWGLNQRGRDPSR